MEILRGSLSKRLKEGLRGTEIEIERERLREMRERL